jgi:hypothetical protein
MVTLEDGTMSSRTCLHYLGLLSIVATFACGGEPRKDGPAAAQTASSSGSHHAIEPCRLASAEQVGKVLPNHDGGSVMFSGGSLVKGIDVYQCSYVNPATDLLTVIVNVAADKERFDSIRKTGSYHSEHKTVSIADAAWVWGEDNDMKVQVEKGRAILDLELMAKGAKDRSDALVDLARTVAAKLP